MKTQNVDFFTGGAPKPKSRRTFVKKLESSTASPLQKSTSFFITKPMIKPGLPVTTTSSKPQSSEYILQKLPKTLNINEFSILAIDEKLRSSFIQDIENVSIIQEKINRIEYIVSRTPDQYQKDIGRTKIQKYQSRLFDCKNSMNLAFYIYKTRDLIEEYKRLNSSRNFILDTTDINNGDAIRKIIKDFIRVASTFIRIVGFEDVGCSTKFNEFICRECNSREYIENYNDDTNLICKNCFTEVQVIDLNPTYRDTGRINMTTKYKYSCKGHFSVAIKHFQGEQNINQNDLAEITSILKREISIHGLTLSRGMKNSVTKNQMYGFLDELGESKFYKHINLIYHVLTGDPAPNIKKYEDALHSDFDEFKRVYDIIKNPNKSNSRNVYYILYKILQHNGYVCCKDDFFILRTESKKDECDEIMMEIFRELKWKWIPTL